MVDSTRQRCFVALPLPAPVLEACLEAQRAVRSLEVPEVSASIGHFSLQRSHLGPVGPRYETLETFGLG